MQPDYVFLIWLVHLQKEPERESYNYFHFNARESSTNGKYGTLLNYFRFHSEEQMKIPVERKVSAYNVKKKEKNGQIELLCLKKRPFWKLFVAMVNDAAPSKKKMTRPQADDTDTEIQGLGKLLDCIHSCQMSTRINPAVKPWQTPANFKRSWVNFSTSREKKI